MNAISAITRSNVFIKLKNWEYWPFGILQFPLFLYFIWLAVRSRSLGFFTASNPGITMGGMFGESKYEVIQKIPNRYIPVTIKVTLPTTTETVLQRLKHAGLTFPVILKPDLGERGFMVKKIDSIKDIDDYLRKINIGFLAQELIDLPLEFGVFYERYPTAQRGKVTSLVMKEMLAVIGDGRSTLKELIFKKDRAKLQWQKLRVTYAEKLNEVIPAGKSIELVSIGNHALGTKFINGNHLVTDALSETFDRISKQIEGFYFGRFDIRCANLEDLYNGKIKIMELNGCGAEPAHIYDPNFRIYEAIVVLFRHWTHIFEIARENRKLGATYTSLKECITHYKKFKAATR